MGHLTFSINITLDGCVDHQEGIADDETHAFFTSLMDDAGAMLWGRVTYEMMESHWPDVARGDEDAPPAMREWAVKLESAPSLRRSRLLRHEFVAESSRSASPRRPTSDWLVDRAAVRLTPRSDARELAGFSCSRFTMPRKSGRACSLESASAPD